ncbi:AraC family transcriptional regulator [Vibrio paucivorans]|uniref:Helix-turn-helix transcriptional regulator n=1 Tax=Vibrio paucivorans TaxID=2829489 RepID=A0A9X3CGB4_9VIBR|nr:helix-turn-helix transcriptional regulator [Vibrio paucivorans]MCW8335342.1 helix-turn-helix transcriptional regulator [Vibrio paucivorans]
MAIIDETTRFDADMLEASVIGIAAEVGKHDSGMHSHCKAQLLFAPQGCMTITLDNTQCILPPTRAAWIPAGVKHCARMNNVVAYRSLYFDQSVSPELEHQVKVFDVSPLFVALIERMAFWPWDIPDKLTTNTVALFFEELASLKEQHLSLPMPTDRRLIPWLSRLQIGDAIVPQLNTLSQTIGASGKTITRIFAKETGMPYQNWRQRWRLQKSIEMLSSGLQVNDVAYQLEFSSDSAFIAFFKQQTGLTPLQYLSPK